MSFRIHQKRRARRFGQASRCSHRGMPVVAWIAFLADAGKWCGVMDHSWSHIGLQEEADQVIFFKPFGQRDGFGRQEVGA
jgi:hypothetical protein